MVGGLTPQAGRFRTVEVCVYSGKKLVHAGLPHKIVPGKVGELLAWVKGGNHPRQAERLLQGDIHCRQDRRRREVRGNHARGIARRTRPDEKGPRKEWQEK